VTSLPGGPFAPGQRLPQKEFYLSIDAAQVIRGPFFQLLPQVIRDPKQESLARFWWHDQV
jgi:hypothetical protein